MFISVSEDLAMYKFSEQVTYIYYYLLQFNSHFKISSATWALLTPLQVQTAAKVRNRKCVFDQVEQTPKGRKLTSSEPCTEPTGHRFVLLKVKIAWHFSSPSLARRQCSWHQEWHVVHTAVLFPGHCRKTHCQTSENLHLGEAENKRSQGESPHCPRGHRGWISAETDTSAGITSMVGTN